ncbi:MAG TPA: ATP phosphoribosyltransferase regulatory subunit [Bacillales bacterium]|nr:ATP phosphoribosyltransferase regulatory subunit [Bacillales bacterium]
MSKPFGFEKPLGMRDTLPSMYETKARLRKTISDAMHRWGYRFVETPALEYFDTVGTATSIEERQLFKLLDQEGKTLVLRPDMTAPIARIAASRLNAEGHPLRLAYDANVYRAQQREGGRPAEFEQLGVELIGDASIAADAEVIALMVHVVRLAGLSKFQVAVGHIGFVQLLLGEATESKEQADQLTRFLYEKNYVGYRRALAEMPLSEEAKQKLETLLDLRGKRETIKRAETVASGAREKAILAEMKELSAILDDFGVGDHVKVDFTLVSHMDYYTGYVFEGLDETIGYPIASGGRYDELLEKFSAPAPATGFAVFFDRLIEAVGERDSEAFTICVLYTADRRAEAMRLAAVKRNKGERVVLQDVAGLDDIETYAGKFDEVVYYLDS